MVKSKIGYILLILALMVALCATSASAERVQLTPDQYFFQYKLRSGFLSGVIGPQSTVPIPSNGYLGQFSKISDGSIPQANPEYFYVGSSYLDDTSSYYFDRSTTYIIEYTFYFQSISQERSFHLNFPSIEVQPYFLYGPNFSNLDGGGLLISGSTAGIMEATNIGADLQITFRVVFRTADNFSSLYPWLCTSFHFTDQVLAGDPGQTNISLVSTSQINAYYDPTGEVIEEETDKIIEGQLAAVDYSHEQEINATNSAADDAAADGQAEAAAAFDFSSFSNALGGLVSALSYSGTDFHFYLPAAQNIPYIGSLWNQQEIPLKTYIDMLPSGILYIIRFLCWLGLLFSVVHAIKKLINIINGGESD